MEESINEWGKVFVLGSSMPLPLPTPVLKVFATTSRSAYPQKSALGAEHSFSPGLALLPFSRNLWPKPFASRRSDTALTVKYAHPKVIEHPERKAALPQHQNPVLPVLLLTAVSTFTAWYIYHLTGQKLALQSQVKSFAETLGQEQQARAWLTAPQIKILTLEGKTEPPVSAKFFWDTEKHSCLIYLRHLPQAGAGQYFQLWFLTKEDQFILAKSFSAENGTAELFLRLPAEQPEELEYVLVSLERAGQHRFPEGEILVKGLWH